MNYAVILAAGVGQRMRSGGLPKQFLKLMGKPIVVYTIEKFEDCSEIDSIIVVCHSAYTELMNELVTTYRLSKVKEIVVGGKERQASLKRGLKAVSRDGASDDDIVLIHDGVRPLVSESTIRENIRVARQKGCAITVRPVTESVVVTPTEDVKIQDFMKRADTYCLTAPQTFQLKKLKKAFESGEDVEVGASGLPLLDAAMVFAQKGGEATLVKEQNNNIKITTPEDYYFLKAMLEMEENRTVFGL